ncbi:unnamed protein product [Lota lota]
MDFHPCLRIQPSSSDLTLQPSPDALRLARAYRTRGYLRWVRKQIVKAVGRFHTLQLYLADRDTEAAADRTQPEPSDAELIAAADAAESQLARDAPPAVTPPGPSAPAFPPAGDVPGQPLPPVLTSGTELLPRSWRQTLPEEQQDWLGRAMFTRGTGAHPVLTSELRLWWFPPGDRPLYAQPPA